MFKKKLSHVFSKRCVHLQGAVLVAVTQPKNIRKLFFAF